MSSRIGMSVVSRRTSSLELTSVPPGNAKLYRSPFWRDFVHLNVAMWTSNNALVPDPDKDDILASKPTDWPFLRLGLRMCGWGDGQIKFYLLGTPVIWWSSSIALLLSMITVGMYAGRMQRQYQDWAPGQWEQFLHVGKVAFGGWALHFSESLVCSAPVTLMLCSAIPRHGPSHISPSLRESWLCSRR